MQDYGALRRSRILQSIGENKVSDNDRNDMNMSIKNDLKYVQKFNPDFSTFSGGTIKQNKGNTFSNTVNILKI